MNILEALSTTVKAIKTWVDENKVDKVGGKGLSTHDYTTEEKNKVANIPNDLVVIDGQLYLAQNGEPFMDSAIVLPESGNKIYIQDSEPNDVDDGTLWLDTNE